MNLFMHRGVTAADEWRQRLSGNNAAQGREIRTIVDGSFFLWRRPPLALGAENFGRDWLKATRGEHEKLQQTNTNKQTKTNQNSGAMTGSYGT
jgi:hypothetical protein